MQTKYRYSFLLSLLLVFFGCETSFLEEKTNPNYLTPSNFWKTEGDILKGLASAYSHLQPNMDWGTPFERFIVVDNYRSDELDFRADVASWLQIATFVNTSTNSVSKKEWTFLYRGINYANQCIDNIPRVEAASEALRNQTVAEARFLRAYYYYRLLLNYGENIPLYKTELKGTEEEFYPKQAVKGEVFDFIVEELTAIQSDLPEPSQYKVEEAGRVNKYAAAAILGKLFLFVNQQEKAEVEFEKIIGKFDLMENYNDNFTGLHKNNKESILEVQFTGDRTAGQSEFNRIALHLASSNAEGYEEAYPSDWLFETMKRDLTVTGEYSERVYSTVLFNDDKSKAFYFKEGQSFLDYHRDGEVFWNKFVSWDPSLSQHWTQSAFNIPVVRYADVLLMYAECLNHRGATVEAIKYINQVRGRVKAREIPSNLNQGEVLKHLQDVERPTELALEGVRWYDLIRWGIVEEALRAHKKPFVENFVKTKHQLFPIPHDEFLLNKDWVQNPNFSK